MYKYIFIASASSSSELQLQSRVHSCLSHCVFAWALEIKGQITSIYKCQLGTISANSCARITNSLFYFLLFFHISFHNLNLWLTKNFHFRATAIAAQNFIDLALYIVTLTLYLLKNEPHFAPFKCHWYYALGFLLFFSIDIIFV